MSDISRKALMSFIKEYTFESNFAKQLYAELESGAFPSTVSEGEVTRLREALEKIKKLQISGLGLSIASSFKEAVRIADEALSPHREDKTTLKFAAGEYPKIKIEDVETVQPDKADKVRSMYELWSSMDGESIYSAETIANIIADIAIVVGIDIPGIDPDDPINLIPNLLEGKEG